MGMLHGRAGSGSYQAPARAGALSGRASAHERGQHPDRTHVASDLLVLSVLLRSACTCSYYYETNPRTREHGGCTRLAEGLPGALVLVLVLLTEFPPIACVVRHSRPTPVIAL